RNYVASAAEVGPLLRELHAALRDYGGPLRRLSPFAEIPQWLDQIESWNIVDPADLAVLRRGFSVVSAEIDAFRLSEQPLHGDAHKKNVLKTGKGLFWTDFEDACFGPIEWDLGCFVRTSLESREIALASYADKLDPNRLEAFFAARDLQGAAWAAILSTRFPDRKERAAEWMAVARSRYG
ncbi:MAG: phosphotransferase, partial [Acidobacteriaceae bacterium]|nr:phosphotransferase [Acidobacteriaceae bacterium]